MEALWNAKTVAQVKLLVYLWKHLYSAHNQIKKRIGDRKHVRQLFT